MSKVSRIIGSAMLILLYGFLVWLFRVPLNPNSFSFWFWAFVGSAVIYNVASTIYYFKSYNNTEADYLGRRYYVPTLMDSLYDKDKLKKTRILIGALGFIPLIVFALWLVGSPIFSSGVYANMLAPEEASFADFSDKLKIESISLMDTDSAVRVGSSELGSLSEVVSQFDDGDYYQIILNGKPQKVSPLQYVGFFSWINNRDNGTPGYVSVDPIRQNADYYELSDIDGTGNGMRYIPSAYFGENLARHVWLANIFSVLGESHFELDDEGHPYFVTQVMDFKTFMGARYVESVIVTDPTDGSMEHYNLDNLPEWLDVVYDGELLDEMYDWHGAFGRGFINSLFGQIGCTRTGGDYGYVEIDGEQWIYTGVTSMGADASNIGFLLASERTAESYFIPMSSADEDSAMRSAEGKVQQFGYEASFPSLVSIDGQPTYVMVLKDDAGLIRLYAFVNAESYNIVACESDLDSTRKAYEQAMASAGITFTRDDQDMPAINTSDSTATQTEVLDASGDKGDSVAPPDSNIHFSGAITSRQFVEIGGETYLYATLQSDSGNLDVLRLTFQDYEYLCMTITDGTHLSGNAIPAGDILVVESLD